jgi:putative endonuclease
MEKFFVYAIKSKKDGRIYVGISKNPLRRLGEHNKGETPSTKAYTPWRLIYKGLFNPRIEARNEEKRLKSGYGKEFLKTIKY